MRHTISTALAAVLTALTSTAITTPLWMRDATIAPDGTRIAFTYKGDIYTVPTSGGTATRLTSLSSLESSPIWSPDSRQIAFASDRHGSRDIFIMSADGGAATRLTTYSGAETPEAFTPDGQEIIFSASIQDPAQSALFPSSILRELYSVSTRGGKMRQILASPALSISWLPDGKSFLYQDIKGMEDPLRKHHTSSVTRDIWIYDATTGQHTNITNRGGEDLNPVLSADKQTIYFLSERQGGSINVHSTPASAPGTDIKQITQFGPHPVRFLSTASDGTLAMGYNGEIYTLAPGGKEPVKVNVTIITDDTSTPLRRRASSATEAAISPDGKQLAFIDRGDIFVTDAEYSSTRQISSTPQGESDITWGKDARELYYTSAREGRYNIYKATIDRADDPNFSNATLVTETAIFPPDTLDRTVPMLSPDGKKLAYILDRNRLMVHDLASGKSTQLTDGRTDPSRTKGFTAQWSPDSRWLLIENRGTSHYPYGDIAIIDAQTGHLVKVTETGYFDEQPRWVLGGEAILFLSERYGMRNHASWGSNYDVMLAFLNQDTYDRYRLSEEDYNLLKEVEKAQKKKAEATKKNTENKKSNSKKEKNKNTDTASADTKTAKKPLIFDLEGIEERTVRLTPNSSSLSDAIVTSDGETLYYLSEFENGFDLWKMNLRKREPKLISKLGSGPATLDIDSEGNIYLYGSSIKKLNPKTDKITPIKISATHNIDTDRERQYMLDFVQREEKERFYTPDMNGVAWDSLVANYRRFLPHINNNADFAIMLSELLGELNVSHTGASYQGTKSSDNPTASLGLLYDMTYTGPGLKVDEVLARGPFGHANTDMTPGSIITAIGTTELTDSINPLEPLNGIAGHKTLVTFTTPDQVKHQEVVLPISLGAANSLLYNRWVAQREHDVDSLSGGRLGYVHIRSMDDESFRHIYAKMLGKYIDREGIVVDTRWNGGGRLHEDIEVLLSAKPYITQDIHGVPTSAMPSRRWTKPSIMITGEANYSNAHGTPWVYKHLGLGKIVGMPVPGTMTSVNWVRMQDPSLVFGIPVVGMRTPQGHYLENHQLEPDIKIANDPATIVLGTDSQIEAAVKELLNEIDSRK